MGLNCICLIEKKRSKFILKLKQHITRRSLFNTHVGISTREIMKPNKLNMLARFHDSNL